MRYLFFFFILLLSNLVQAKIDVSFVPKTVKQGDSVELILSSDNPFQGVPNLEILQNDFVVGGQQKKQSAQWINGKGSTTYQLIYTLFPNKSGTISVKGLKVGTEVLPEVTLTVANDVAYEQGGGISLSIDCPQTTLYPAQKLLCQLNLDDTLGLVDGELIPPEVSNGTWEQLLPLVPSDQSTDTQRRYQGLFSFTPTQSGKIEIPPFTFRGQVRLKTAPSKRASNIIDLMILGFQNTATKPVAVQSKPLTLTVKEKPADYQGWWLPSSQVTLKEQYEMPSSIHTGEPITRTLTLFAQDVSAANLPVPSITQAPGFKIYTNPEQRKDLPNGSELKVSLTFVPTQSGDLTLPTITVPWFNTQTETLQQASVPTKDIFVATDVASQNIDTPASPILETPKEKETPVLSNQKESSQPTSFVQTTHIPWIWIILAVILAFASGIIITILVLKKRQSKEAKKKAPLPDLYPF